MFGFVRPVKDELKVRDFEVFKACYCSLCHSMGKNYGAFSRLFLNYDFTFLAMLLWDGDMPESNCRRCVASPFVGKKCYNDNKALQRAAGQSIILTYWKLRDDIADEKFFSSLKSRAALLLMKGAYKKARRDLGGFDAAVSQKLSELSEIEVAGSSLDGAADKFASILAFAAAGEENERVLKELLYHTGRLIYILDAVYDFDEDVRLGRHNILSRRFQIESGGLSDGDIRTLRVTLEHSRKLIVSAFELLPESIMTPILQNIIYLGMQVTCCAVLSGKWSTKVKSKHFKKDWSDL
jgi:hypothetical protein